jgi:putative flippase GtrA
MTSDERARSLQIRRWREPRPPVVQFARFLTVGASNTIVSYVVYTALLWVGVIYWLSGALAFVVGAVNGYIFNRRWTFVATDDLATRVRYGVVQGAAVVATSGLLWFVVNLLSVGRLVAYAIAAPAVTAAMFLANRGWVFRNDRTYEQHDARP